MLAEQQTTGVVLGEVVRAADDCRQLGGDASGVLPDGVHVLDGREERRWLNRLKHHRKHASERAVPSDERSPLLSDPLARDRTGRQDQDQEAALAEGAVDVEDEVGGGSDRGFVEIDPRAQGL